MKKLYKLPIILLVGLTLGYTAVAQQTNTIPIRDIMNEDGSLNIRDFAGTIDPSGYFMEVGEDGKPRFYPTSNKPDLKLLPTDQDQLLRKEEGDGPSPLGLVANANWDTRLDANNGVDLANVYAVAVDASGAVYVGGDFTNGGGIGIQHLAKYDGVSWSSLGGDDAITGNVYAIEIDGTDVYIGGWFYAAGGTNNANRIAKWNGSSWIALGNGGISGTVQDIEVVSSNEVYIGGYLYDLDGATGSNIAVWDGAAWNGLGYGTSSDVFAIEYNPTYNELYVGGWFGSGVYDDLGFVVPETEYVAKWDIGTSTWLPMGTGASYVVRDILISPSSDNQVYFGGWFGQMYDDSLAFVPNTQYLAKWDASTSAWGTVGGTKFLNNYVYNLATDGTDIYVVGDFTSYTEFSSTFDVNRTVKFNNVVNTTWSGLGFGVTDHAEAIAAFGSNVYVGGRFVSASGVSARRIAKYNGASWSALGEGLRGGNSANVNAIKVVGDKVYVAGYFNEAGGIPVNNIAEWDQVTNTWSDVGGGLESTVYALDHDGSNLIAAGGYFSNVSNYLAFWNGAGWTAPAASPNNWLYEMNHNPVDGNIYVGTWGTIAGIAERIGYWDGATWNALGPGLNDRPFDIEFNGTDVYASGYLTATGDNLTPLNHIAHWDGANWNQLGGGISSVEIYAMEWYDSDLYIAGVIWDADGTPVSNMAKWNGTTWEDSSVDPDWRTDDLLAAPDGNLYIGGSSWSANQNFDAHYVFAYNADLDIIAPLGTGTNSTVNDIDYSNGKLFLGGYFDMAGELPSGGIASWINPVISTGALATTSFAGRDIIDVDFTVDAGVLDDDNVMIAEISDATGDFSNGIELGRVTTTTSGSIQAIIPVGIATGALYKVRVRATSPLVTGADSGQEITITGPGFGLDYFWVGEGGSWTDVSHWATSSNGSTNHVTPPTRYDDVTFDLFSFSADGAVVTIDAEPAYAADLSFSTVDQAIVLTQADWPNRLKLYGKFELNANVDPQLRNVDFYSDNLGNNIITGNQSLGNNAVFAFYGSGSWIMQDDLSLWFIDHYNGTFDTNDHFLQMFQGYRSYTDDPKTFDMGASTIEVTGTWEPLAANTNLLATSAEIHLVDRIQFHGDRTYGNVTFDKTLDWDNHYIYGNNTFNTLTLMPGSVNYFGYWATQTIGDFQLNGTKAEPIEIRSTSSNDSTTFNVATGSVLGDYLVLENTNATGVGVIPFIANNSLDEGGNTGWSIQPPTALNYFWVGNGGNWSDYQNHWATGSGGATFHSGPPGIFDNAIFDDNSFSLENQEVLMDADANVNNMLWTDATNNPSFNNFDWNNRLVIEGSLEFIEEMNIDMRDIVFVSDEMGNKITTGSLQNGEYYFEGPGEWILQDSLKTWNAINYRDGDLNLNGQYVDTWAIWVNDNVGTPKIFTLDSSTIRTNYWQMNTSQTTLDPGTSTILFDDWGAFWGGGFTYNDLEVDNAQFSNQLEVYQDNVFNNFTIHPGSKVRFGSGNTQTMTQFSVTGLSSALIDIGSTSDGNQFFLSQALNSVIGDYIIIQDSNVGGGASFIADNSLDNGNNTGWLNINAPVPLEFYWVGGGGNWSDYTSHWATTSGGGTYHSAIPGLFDNIHFDANSFTNSGEKVIVDLDAINGNNMDWTGASNNPIFEADWGKTITLFGSLTIPDGVVNDLKEIYFKANGPTTISTGGSLGRSSSVRIEGSGDFVIGDSLKVDYLGYNGAGSLDFNDQDVFAWWYVEFYGNESNTAYLRGSKIDVRNWGSYNWSQTLDAGTSLINIGMDGNGGFDGGPGYTFPDVTFDGSVYVYGDNHFNTLTVLPSSDIQFSYWNNHSMDILNVTGERGKGIGIRSTSNGNLATISVASGTVNGDYLILQDNAATGGATFNALNTIDNGNVTGWNITPIVSADYYWIGDGGSWSDVSHWSTTSGGTADAGVTPSSVDNVYFDLNSFTATGQTVVVDIEEAQVDNIDWTGVANNPHFSSYTTNNSNKLSVFGSATFSPNMTKDIFRLYLYSNESETITSGNSTFGQNNRLIFSGGGYYTILDSISTFSLGFNSSDLTVDFLGNPVYATYLWGGGNNTNVILAGSNVRSNGYISIGNLNSLDISNANLSTSYWEIYGSVGSLNNLNSNIEISSGLFSPPQFYGGNQTYNDVIFDISANVWQSNSFNNFTANPGTTVTFEESSIQTAVQFVFNGTKSGPIGLKSYAAGTQANLNQVSGNVNASYLELQDNNAQGGAFFDAFNSIDNGNVSGWNITQPVSEDYYWVGDAGNWSDYDAHWATSTGGATFHVGPPSRFDNVYFDANSFTTSDQTVVMDDLTGAAKNLDWSGVTNQPHFFFPDDASYEFNITGDLILSSQMDASLGRIDFSGSGNNSIVTGNIDLGGGSNFYFDGSGSWTFLDDLNLGWVIELREGDLDFSGRFVDLGDFVATGNGAKSMNITNATLRTQYFRLYGSTSATIVGSTIRLHESGFWDAGTSLFEDLVVESAQYPIEFYGDMAFDDVTFEPGAKVVIADWSTMTANQFTAVGDKNNFIELGSNNPGFQGSIVQSTGTVDADFIILQDNDASGGAIFNATNAIDNGNVSGWNITAPVPSEYYWVGDAGDWSDFSNHWATAPGGTTPHSSAPGLIDNVHFDEFSFALGGTLNLDQQISVNTMVWTNVTNNPTFEGNWYDISIYGSLHMGSDLSTSNIGLIRFESSGAGNLITSAGKLDGAVLNFRGSGDWTFNDAVSAWNIEMNSGTLNTGDQPIDLGDRFYIGLNQASTLNLGASIMTMRSWHNHTWPNYLTMDAGTSSITVTDGSFDGNGFAYNNVELGGESWMSSSNNFNELKFASGSITHLPAFETQTIASLVAVGERSNPIVIQSNSDGDQATISQGSGTVSADYVVLKDNNATGGAVFDANNAIEDDNVSGWNITPMTALNYYWVGNSGNWSDFGTHWATTSGGGTFHPSAPGFVDAVVFDSQSFSATNETVTADADVFVGNMNWNGATNNPTLEASSVDVTITGSLEMPAAVSRNFGNVLMAGSGIHDLTLGGVDNGGGSAFGFVGGGSWTLRSDVIAQQFVVSSGYVDLNGRNITVEEFRIESQDSKEIDMRDSQVSVMYWRNYSDGSSLTFNKGTSIINLRDGGNFRGDNSGTGPFVYNDLVVEGYTEIYDLNIFNGVTLNPGSTTVLEAGTTQTTNSISAIGTLTEQISISSNSNGVQATISQGFGTVNADYLVIQDNNAIGGATFNADHTDREGGNVTGWNVTDIVYDQENPVITSTTGSTIDIGGTITVGANVTDNMGVALVELYYRNISSTAGFNLLQLANTGGNAFTTSFSQASFDAIGLEYYFRAVDIYDNETTTGSDYVYLNYSGSSDVNLSVSTGIEVTNYQIIAIPMESASVNNVFAGLMPYDEEIWRLFHYSNGSNTEKKSGNLDPGLGYWLISKDQGTISFGGLHVAEANQDNPISILLTSGWNQIGNPYTFGVNWANVLTHNENMGIISPGELGDLNTYNGGWRSSSDLAEYEGAYVDYQGSGSIQIEIPVTINSGARIKDETTTLDEDNWKVNLFVKNDQLIYGVAGFGMNPAAKPGLDIYDGKALPRFSDYLDVNFGEYNGIEITKSLIPTDESAVWSFDVNSSFESELTNMSWDNTVFGDNEQQLVLFDKTLNRVVDMRLASDYNFTVKDKHQFEVYFGSVDFVNSSLKPSEIALGLVYPNPFSDIATITFGLEEASQPYEVTMQVFNSVGEVVSTLIDESLQGGFYSSTWDGTNNSGQELKSGLYIYRVVVQGDSGTKTLSGKLLLKK